MPGLWENLLRQRVFTDTDSDDEPGSADILRQSLPALQSATEAEHEYSATESRCASSMINSTLL